MRIPIVVTGTNRSGTTWVGTTLALSQDIGYIFEPLSPYHRPGVFKAEVPCWYQHIDEENGGTYEDALRRTISFQYGFLDEFRAIRSIRDIGSMVRTGAYFTLCRLQHRRALLKDPASIFAAEWLSETLGSDIIITIRHPAAFASSLKRYDWPHPFTHFVKQPRLMERYLEPFRPQIEAFAQSEHDIIDQAILFWRITYSVVRSYREKHKDWLYVRHEDLSQDPVAGFRRIFNHLNLDYTSQIRETIARRTASDNPSEASHALDLQINSRANIKNWKKRLTECEIRRVYDGVRDVSKSFYEDSEW